MNCQICGAELPHDALFCGECGSSTSATAQSRQRHDHRPSDTTVIQPLRARQTTGIISVALDSVPLDSMAPKLPVVRDAAPIEQPSERSADAAAVPPAPAAPVVQSSEHVDEQWPSEPRGATSGISFVLQFSTGESFDVRGSGLIGRRPLPQPHERFDHLIQINDTGRSVSKSHLEFGLHDGELWVCDRASGNGTVLLRPDGTVLPCEPGRRYLVSRGTRVEIGEQFFVVA